MNKKEFNELLKFIKLFENQKVSIYTKEDDESGEECFEIYCDDKESLLVITCFANKPMEVYYSNIHDETWEVN